MTDDEKDAVLKHRIEDFERIYGDIGVAEMLFGLLATAYIHPEWAAWWGQIFEDQAPDFPTFTILNVLPAGFPE